MLTGWLRSCGLLLGLGALIAAAAIGATDSPAWAEAAGGSALSGVPEPTRSEREADAKLQWLLRTYLPQQSKFSLDTTPVRFFIRDALFNVPRNYLVRLPTHVVNETDPPTPPEADQSNLAVIHAVLPDMQGLTRNNAACYLKGSGCPEVVRIILSSTAVLPGREQLENHRRSDPLLSGDSVRVAPDLLAYPDGSYAERQIYVGELGDEEVVVFHCRTSVVTNLCSSRIPLSGGGRVGILFNRAYERQWHLVYDGVQRLVSSFQRVD